MIGDTLDSLDDASLETEADAEVDKVITEITSGILAPAGAAPTKAIPQKAPATAAATTVRPILPFSINLTSKTNPFVLFLG